MTDSFDFCPRTRLIYGSGTIERLSQFCKELHIEKPLLVADPGLREAGHVDRIMRLLRDSNLKPVPFHNFDVNPTTTMVESGRTFSITKDVESCGVSK